MEDIILLYTILNVTTYKSIFFLFLHKFLMNNLMFILYTKFMLNDKKDYTIQKTFLRLVFNYLILGL